MPVQADILSVAGNTSGTFASTNTNTVNNLTFTGANFSGTTSLSGNLALTNLGKFQLGLCSGLFCSTNYSMQDFTLSVSLSLPTGVNGSPSPFSANLNGTVIRLLGVPLGNVDVLFQNPTHTFNYSNATGNGSFVLTLNNVMNLTQTGSSSSKFLTGAISSAVFNPVPEPGSIMLMGTLMVGVGLIARKRLRKV
jgi:hypothetical protein